MKILLLGASGLLGHNVLKQLLAAGHEVHALLRDSSSIHLPAEECAGLTTGPFPKQTPQSLRDSSQGSATPFPFPLAGGRLSLRSEWE